MTTLMDSNVWSNDSSNHGPDERADVPTRVFGDVFGVHVHIDIEIEVEVMIRIVVLVSVVVPASFYFAGPAQLDVALEGLGFESRAAGPQLERVALANRRPREREREARIDVAVRGRDRDRDIGA